MTPVPPRDEAVALQRERTALAWDRTGVGLIVAGALYVRAVPAALPDLRHVPGLVAMLVGIGLIPFAYRRFTRPDGRAGGGTFTHPGAVILTGVVTVAFAGAALALVLWPG